MIPLALTPFLPHISFIPVRPLTVQILQKPRQMIADEEYTIQCEVTGSRPKATVTWTRDNRIFRRGKVRSHVIVLGLMDIGMLQSAEGNR